MRWPQWYWPLPVIGTTGNLSRPIQQSKKDRRTAAIEHFDGWRKDVLARLKEALSAPDDVAIVGERRRARFTIAITSLLQLLAHHCNAREVLDVSGGAAKARARHLGHRL